MKLRLFLIVLSLALLPSFTCPADHDAKQISFEIIAALSSDIAELIINKKQTNNPQLTKTHCVNIIKHMTEIIAAIIMKINERKQTRSINEYSNQDDAILIENIVNQILQKIDYQSDCA